MLRTSTYAFCREISIYPILSYPILSSKIQYASKHVTASETQLHRLEDQFCHGNHHLIVPA